MFKLHKTICTSALALTLLGTVGVGVVHATEQSQEDSPVQAVTYQWQVPNKASLEFVAERLAAVNGFQLPAQFAVSAEYWSLYAFFQGYIVDLEPQVGSVAWFDAEDFGAGDYGHVAWVKSVNGDEVEIEEINQDNRYAPYTYRTRIIHREEVGGYIHFKDL